VGNKDYIERLKQVIFHLHKSGANHVGTVPVEEIFRGKTLWKGDVEVFDLTGHPKAKRCYGWTTGFNVGLSVRPDMIIQAGIENSKNCYD
jgi:hypothetical protein